MFGVTDLLSFNIGFFMGVFGSYLIYVAYHIADSYVAQRKIDSFFDKFGVSKGIAFYEKIVENCDDESVKRKLSEKTEEYIKTAKIHEEQLDELINEYMNDNPTFENND
jgi:hypothetical protein